jgi:hypothetical protein
MLRTAALALALSFSIGVAIAPRPARAAVPEEVSAATMPVPAKTPADTAELAALAEREAAAPDLQKFRGGDTTTVVYVGGGGLGLLLVVLLIVLLVS